MMRSYSDRYIQNRLDFQFDEFSYDPFKVRVEAFPVQNDAGTMRQGSFSVPSSLMWHIRMKFHSAASASPRESGKSSLGATDLEFAPIANLSEMAVAFPSLRCSYWGKFRALLSEDGTHLTVAKLRNYTRATGYGHRRVEQASSILKRMQSRETFPLLPSSALVDTSTQLERMLCRPTSVDLYDCKITSEAAFLNQVTHTGNRPYFGSDGIDILEGEFMVYPYCEITVNFDLRHVTASSHARMQAVEKCEPILRGLYDKNYANKLLNKLVKESQ